MATFSTNQARQVYVATAETTAFDPSTSAKGAIQFVAPAHSDSVYFLYKGVDTPMRSDLINKDLIMKASLTHGNNIAKYLHQYEVVLNTRAYGLQDITDPIGGQQYVLRIDLLGYASLGMDQTYQKYGYVKAIPNMTSTEFYFQMAKSLAQNFSREATPIYEFYVSSAAPGATTIFTGASTNAYKVEANSKRSDFTGGLQKLVIREVSGVWKRGTDEDMPQAAHIFTDQILVDGIYAEWGTVTEIHNTVTSSGAMTEVLTKRTNSVHNQLSDLEYFCLGERGDVYRNVGFPYVISSSYMMDEISKTADLGIIDIHYSYVGSNEAVQKSEKDCTIIAPWNIALSIAKKMVGAGIPVTQIAANHVASALTA